MNFTVQKKGPTVPDGLENQSSFNSVKWQANGGTRLFKVGDVVKMTAGKIRIRNEEDKTFTESMSRWAEKGDIITVRGPIYTENLDKDEHAAARVFNHRKSVMF